MLSDNNDEAGQKCTAKFPYQAIKMPETFKDINEWLVNSLQKPQGADTDVLEIKECI